MESARGRYTHQARPAARPEELVNDQHRNPWPIRKVLQAAVVQSALAGGSAPPLHSDGGRRHRPGPRRPREQVGHDLAPPAREDGQRD
ncbi:hypothetical protein LINPERPRIM_LOCUS10162 [Linum perenne]